MSDNPPSYFKSIMRGIWKSAILSGLFARGSRRCDPGVARAFGSLRLPVFFGIYLVVSGFTMVFLAFTLAGLALEPFF